jgi:hypothetical protein
MEEREEYGTAPRSTFCVLLRSTHLQEYVPLPRSTFYLEEHPWQPWVLGQIVQLKTRRIYEQINAAAPFINTRLPVACTEHEDLLFWHKSLIALNVCSLLESAGLERIVLTDVSAETTAGTDPNGVLLSSRDCCISSNSSVLTAGVRTSSGLLNSSGKDTGTVVFSMDSSARAAGAVYYDHEGHKRVATATFDAAEAAQPSTYRRPCLHVVSAQPLPGAPRSSRHCCAVAVKTKLTSKLN